MQERGGRGFKLKLAVLTALAGGTYLYLSGERPPVQDPVVGAAMGEAPRPVESAGPARQGERARLDMSPLPESPPAEKDEAPHPKAADGAVPPASADAATLQGLDNFYGALHANPELLLDTLDDGALRLAMIERVVQARDDRFIGPLREMLTSDDPEIRSEARSTLRRMDTASSREALEKADAGPELLRSIPSEVFEKVLSNAEKAQEK